MRLLVNVSLGVLMIASAIVVGVGIVVTLAVFLTTIIHAVPHA